jgi:subtilase family serine protease
VTVTLCVRLSNSGNIAVTQPFSVTLYDSASQQIGSFPVNSLEGCGDVAEAVVTWPSVAPGTHVIEVRVDPTDQVSETREDDNEMSVLVLVATYRVHVPIVLRSR